MRPETLWGRERSLALTARPFLRWAGGKQRWIINNKDTFPHFQGRYFEPFLGGASVFFHLVRTEPRPFEAWLGDTNLQLIRTYKAIRNDVESVIDDVQSIAAGYRAAVDKRRFYEDVRNTFNDGLPKANPARFIFLNATCWNGLWRTNQAGRFNVPYGAPKTEDVMPTAVALRSASAALQNARVRSSSWENLVNAAGRTDFVFLDPPYYSDVIAKSQKYGNEAWGLPEHERLARTLTDLDSRGAQFVLTNSGEQEMYDMYKDLGFRVDRVNVPRAINSKADERQPVGEIIVRNAVVQSTPESPAGVLLDITMMATRQRFDQP